MESHAAVEAVVEADEGTGDVVLVIDDDDNVLHYVPTGATGRSALLMVLFAAFGLGYAQWQTGSILPLALDPAPSPQLPGRFEVFAEPDGEQLVLDGAHTEASLRAVAAELQRRSPGRAPVVLTAAAAGKRWREGLSALLPTADSFVVTELSGTPCEDPAVISAWLAARGARSEVTPDVRAGLRALRRRPGPRLVVGSFYLAGAVRQLVCDHDPRESNEPRS